MRLLQKRCSFYKNESRRTNLSALEQQLSILGITFVLVVIAIVGEFRQSLQREPDQPSPVAHDEVRGTLP